MMSKVSKFTLNPIDIWNIKTEGKMYTRPEFLERGKGITPEQQQIYGWNDEMIENIEKVWVRE